MRKEKKRIAPKPSEFTKEPPARNRWQETENWLAERSRFVLMGLLAAGIILRMIYFLQLNSTPCISYHLYVDSDMSFFDKWAMHLADDDWLQHTSYNNYTTANKWIAEGYLKRHSEKIEELKKIYPDSLRKNFSDYGRLLFSSWQSDKVYFQEPFYTYCVAIVYKIFGHDVRYIFLFQMLIGLGSMALIFLIAREYFGNIAAFSAGIIALLHGPLIFYELVLLRETIIVFMGLLIVYMISQSMRSKKKSSLLWTGMIIGFSILTKSIFLIFAVLFLILIVLDAYRNSATALKNMVLALTGIVIGLLPLIIRNLAVGISPFAIASSGAYSYISCNYFGYQPVRSFALSYSLCDILYHSGGTFFSSVTETLKTFPSIADYAALLWEKFKLIFLWIEIPNNKSFYYFKLNAPLLNAAFINFSVIAGLGLTGVVISFFRKQKPFALYFLAATHFLILIGFLVLSRYRIPFTAALIPFCGLTVSEIFRRAERKDVMTLGLVVPVIVLFLTVNRNLPRELFPIRADDYGTPYYFYYQPRIDQAMRNNNPATALLEMETFFKIAPPELKKLNANTASVNTNQLNCARIYGLIYSTYSDIASANKLEDRAKEYKARAIELDNIYTESGEALDAFAKVKKALASRDPELRKTFLQSAVQELDVRLKTNPDDFNSLVTMADAKLGLFDSVQYEQYMRAALKVNPTYSKALYSFGDYFLRSRKNLEEAKGLIEKSLNGMSLNADAYTDMGVYYALKQDFKTARSFWLKAVEINPADCSAVRNLEVLKTIKGKD